MLFRHACSTDGSGVEEQPGELSQFLTDWSLSHGKQKASHTSYVHPDTNTYESIFHAGECFRLLSNAVVCYRRLSNAMIPLVFHREGNIFQSFTFKHIISYPKRWQQVFRARPRNGHVSSARRTEQGHPHRAPNKISCRYV